MLNQTRHMLKHPNAVLIGDAVGVAVLFAGLFVGLNIVS